MGGGGIDFIGDYNRSLFFFNYFCPWKEFSLDIEKHWKSRNFGDQRSTLPIVFLT